MAIQFENVPCPGHIWEGPCFFCGEEVEGDLIGWMGQTGPDLILHPTCAVNLMIRLMRDVHEYQHTTGVRLAPIKERVEPLETEVLLPGGKL